MSKRPYGVPDKLPLEYDQALTTHCNRLHKIQVTAEFSNSCSVANHIQDTNLSQLPADSATANLPRHPTLSLDYLEPKARSQFSGVCQGIDLKFTYDGQGALYQVFSSLRRNGRRYALLPAFHCPTVVEPAIRAGLTPRFYRINEDLSIDYRSFEDGLDRHVAAALIIDYFGFPSNVSLIKTQCEDCGVAVVEDCAHSFLHANPIRLAGDRGDLAIYSFKKIMPTQLGGGIRNNSDNIFLDHQLRRPPLFDSLKHLKLILDNSIAYSRSNRVKDFSNFLHRIRSIIRRKELAENSNRKSQPEDTRFDYPFHLHLANSAMPWYSKRILLMSDLDRVVRARRRNFRIFQAGISEIDQLSLPFAELNKSACPWAFPVLLEDRSHHDHQLQSLGVPLFTFGETLHPKLLDGTAANSEAIDSARFLSSRMLCFSIHQGISADLQPRLADMIVNHFD